MTVRPRRRRSRAHRCGDRRMGFAEAGATPAGPAVARHPGPVGRAGERDPGPADPVWPGSSPPITGSWRVPDPGGMRRGPARRRAAGVGGHGLQPTGEVSPPARPGSSWPTTAARSPTTSTRCSPCPASVPIRPGPSSPSPSNATWGGRHQRRPGDRPCRGGPSAASGGGAGAGRRHGAARPGVVVRAGPPRSGGDRVHARGRPDCPACPLRRRCRWARCGPPAARPGPWFGRGIGGPGTASPARTARAGDDWWPPCGPDPSTPTGWPAAPDGPTIRHGPPGWRTVWSPRDWRAGTAGGPSVCRDGPPS